MQAATPQTVCNVKFSFAPIPGKYADPYVVSADHLGGEPLTKEELDAFNIEFYEWVFQKVGRKLLW